MKRQEFINIGKADSGSPSSSPSRKNVDEKPKQSPEGRSLFRHQTISQFSSSKSSSPSRSPGLKRRPNGGTYFESPATKPRRSEVAQTREKNQIIRAIYDFYDLHAEGPQSVVDALIKKFKDMSFHEQSLRSSYENLSNLVLKPILYFEVTYFDRERGRLMNWNHS